MQTFRKEHTNESSAADRLIYMDVLATSGGNTILVDDASQVFYGIVNGGERFTILGFHDKANAVCVRSNTSCVCRR